MSNTAKNVESSTIGSQHESKLTTRRVLARKKRKSRTQPKRGVNPFKILVRSTEWSPEERAALYLGLKKHGMLDIKTLTKLVKTKSEGEVQNFIQVSWKTTRQLINSVAKKKQLESREAPIESWLQEVEIATPNSHAFNSAYCKVLPKVLLCIAKFGDHPDPAECGGVDFHEAYEYLFYILSGLPGKTLSPATAHFIMNSVPQLGATIRQELHHQTKNFLFHYESCSTRSMNSKNLASSKNYSRSKEDIQVSNPIKAMQCLMDLPGFNPLGVPLQTLKRAT